jgi:hypothetical protein
LSANYRLGLGQLQRVIRDFPDPYLQLQMGKVFEPGQIAQYNSAATPLFPLDIGGNYGPQGFDVKFIYNLSM